MPVETFLSRRQTLMAAAALVVSVPLPMALTGALTGAVTVAPTVAPTVSLHETPTVAPTVAPTVPLHEAAIVCVVYSYDDDTLEPDGADIVYQDGVQQTVRRDGLAALATRMDANMAAWQVSKVSALQGRLQRRQSG